MSQEGECAFNHPAQGSFSQRWGLIFSEISTSRPSCSFTSETKVPRYPASAQNFWIDRYRSQTWQHELPPPSCRWCSGGGGHCVRLVVCLTASRPALTWCSSFPLSPGLFPPDMIIMTYAYVYIKMGYFTNAYVYFCIICMCTYVLNDGIIL